MLRRLQMACGLVILANSLSIASLLGQETSHDHALWPGADLFQSSIVRRIRIQISAGDLEKLRNEARQFVSATVIEDGAIYHDVGLHLKGSVGSFRPVDDKPGFTLDFSHFAPAQRFHGLRRIHLNNSVEDPSYCNEQLGTELFQSAGIPAPRVGHALVIFNDHNPALYVLKEGFTEDFLACHFKEISGNLYEPGEGHDVNQRLKRTSIQAPSRSHARLQALGKAALETDLQKRWNKLSEILAMDEFIRFMVLEVMLCHRDGYCLARNNFRVYEDAQMGKIFFFPHGMDQLFGLAALPWQPHMAGLVAQAVMETPQGKKRYKECFESIFQSQFKPDVLTNLVDEIVTRFASAVDSSELRTIRESAAELKQKIIARHQDLERQLSQPQAEPLQFTNGEALLTLWSAEGQAEQSHTDRVLGPRECDSLHIRVSAPAAPFWRTRGWLAGGHYRFEAKVRVSGVLPLEFGVHQGAGLRIGNEVRSSSGLIGNSEWRQLATEFEVGPGGEEVQFICELRARAGEVWFDCASLKVRQTR